MMDIHDDDSGIMVELEPSPDFTQRVTERVAELEGIRQLAREQGRQVWRLVLACVFGSLLLAWLVTVPLLPAAGALVHTAYHLLDEAAATSGRLASMPLLIGVLVGTAMGLIGAARAARAIARDSGGSLPNLRA
ncbi:MAG TPA: hypothetical protein QGH10_23740 [Armatimonadota bacterium]|nr:hypothetical protein [Armatimonadota bacterium]